MSDTIHALETIKEEAAYTLWSSDSELSYRRCHNAISIDGLELDLKSSRNFLKLSSTARW